MKKASFLFIFIVVSCGLNAQDKGADVTPKLIFSEPYRIEKLKNGDDCTFLSYTIGEFNNTESRRDDTFVGSFFFASGKDCKKCFEETHRSMVSFKNENFALPATETISMLPDEKLHMVTSYRVINTGYTKGYATYFFGDRGTPEVSEDDQVLGFDLIIDSADPDAIAGYNDLAWVEGNAQTILSRKEIFSSTPYVSLREQIINRNLIVDQLRSEKKLIDITPEQQVKKIRLRQVEN